MFFFSIALEKEATKQKLNNVQTVKLKSNQRPNAFTMLHYLQASKKNGSSDDPTKSCENLVTGNVQRTNIQSQLNVVSSSRNMNISKISTKTSRSFLLLEENFESMTSSSPLKVTNATDTNPGSATVERRRSKRLDPRRSSFDFKACKQNFRKPNSQPVIPDVPEQFSLAENEEIDLNVSFVHDETRVLFALHR